MADTARELARIAETINRGITGLGSAKLAGHQAGLESSKLDYLLGRNRRADERAVEEWALKKPALELTSGRAQALNEYLAQPASYNKEMPDAYAAAHFANFLAPKLSKLYDAKWVQDKQGISRLQKKDGSYVTNFDRESRKNEELGIFKSSFKLRSTLKDQIARWQERKDMIEGTGIPIARTQAGHEVNRLNRNIAEANRVMNDPNEMIRRLEEQKADIQLMGNFPEEVKRLEKEISEERKKLMTPKERKLYDIKLKTAETQLETAKAKQKSSKMLGGLTVNQWLMKLDRDRKFARQSKKDKAAIIKDGITQYNALYTHPMSGGLVEDAPDIEQYLKEYARLRTGGEKETGEIDQEEIQAQYNRYRAEGKSKDEAFRLATGKKKSGGAGGSF